jgi:ankyrin repeat protein
MAEALLSRGVKLDATNHRGETALHVVSRGRHDLEGGIRVTELLLEHGMDVNAQDNNHNSPLHSASYGGNLEIARLLVNHGAQTDAMNDQGETPLHEVSHGEYESQADGVDLAVLLLEDGVDVNAQDNEGLTPLHLASWCGKLELARLLLEHVDLENDRARALPGFCLAGKYNPPEGDINITHTFSRAQRGFDYEARNPTTFCMLQREARDRTAAS